MLGRRPFPTHVNLLVAILSLLDITPIVGFHLTNKASSHRRLKQNAVCPQSLALSTKVGRSEAKLSQTSTSTAERNEGGGAASIPNEIFNLVKSIIGAGVLSLPAGTSETQYI
jgi:hypothetical protein